MRSRFSSIIIENSSHIAISDAANTMRNVKTGDFW